MDTASIRTGLLNWFSINARRLPWRVRYAPYEIWISEIMLQQTQVQTMLPYYHRWIKRFPDIQTVAEASEEEVLWYWEGMGYYGRARNIQRTARIVLERFGGDFPRHHETILSFPGIGRYTAGAIMSIAFNENYPAVDGNIARVLCRLLNLDKPIRDRSIQKLLWQSAGRLLPEGRARDFNQALMDLGAAVCLSKAPACANCPISASCKAFASGLVHSRPVPAASRRAMTIEAALGILIDEGKVFIQKRPPGGLMPHLWEFPGGKLEKGEEPHRALKRELREELGVDIRCREKLAVIRHSYTSFRVTLHAFLCHMDPPGQLPVLRSAIDSRWVTPAELDHFPFPAANRKLIRMIRSRLSDFVQD